ncbi:TRAP transporter small permease [Poseidonocella sp. HB161398]|uniref:TRAP transporter small permease n=1 Tax=Poseidonocella sp. HB161398 TaxID=2320855 RepID=UPI001107D2BC|nr:TRAP transporter small permease subunit [Poseidonocella sp. HB161398]
MTSRPTSFRQQAGALAGLLVKAAFWVACAALVVIVCITIYEITMRYFFDSPTSWVSDSVRYLLAFLIMLGLPEVTREEGHVSIALLAGHLRPGHPYLRLLAGISALACFAVTYFALDVALAQAARDVLTQGTWRIPRVWITGSIAAGFSIAGLVFLALALLPRERP